MMNEVMNSEVIVSQEIDLVEVLMTAEIIKKNMDCYFMYAGSVV